MSVNERGFSLLEVLIAMAISSILLLSSARFLPVLQREILRNTRQLALEDEIWQRAYTVAKHLQRAGYCRGNCVGEGLVISAKGIVSLHAGMPTATAFGRAVPRKRLMLSGFVYRIRYWKTCVEPPAALEKDGRK